MKGYRKTGGEKGFTLVELLVVIGIMATMVAIGAPAMLSGITHHRLKSSTREAFTELNAARVNAISENLKHRVEFTINTGTPDTFVMSRYESGSWSAVASRHTIEMASGVNITSPTSDFTVEFFPNGTATATSICIENSHNTADRMLITVTSSTGKVEVQQDSC